jgi:hypothetical protein
MTLTVTDQVSADTKPATAHKRARRLWRVWFVHSSGRFDRSAHVWVASLRRLRKLGVVITGTEAAGRSAADMARAFGDTWAFAHLTGAAQGESFAAWDTRVLTLVSRPKAYKLSDLTWTRAPEYGGKPAAKVHALVVPLQPVKGKRRRIFLVIVHMPLDNTDKRAEAWVDCCKGLRELTDQLHDMDPDAEVVLVGDWNKDQRDHREAAMMRLHLTGPLGLRNSWDGWLSRLSAGDGTHGRQIIDAALLVARMLIRCVLITDDASSDHRPFRYKVRLRRAPKGKR